MGKNVFMIAGIALITILASQCAMGKTNNKIVKDIDGNVYKTLTIGTQTWMAENLKVTKYRDGTPIPLIIDSAAWRELKSGAYCNYDNDTAKADIYGRLYNFYAVVDPKNICPKGWHVPTDVEWQKLIDYLGGEKIAGGKLKEAGNSHWSKNVGATNKSGFTALPGGCRDENIVGDNTFDWIGLRGMFWSSTEWGNGASWFRDLQDINPHVNREHWGNQKGFSVRCVRD